MCESLEAETLLRGGKRFVSENKIKMKVTVQFFIAAYFTIQKIIVNANLRYGNRAKIIYLVELAGSDFK